MLHSSLAQIGNKRAALGHVANLPFEE